MQCNALYMQNAVCFLCSVFPVFLQVGGIDTQTQVFTTSAQFLAGVSAQLDTPATLQDNQIFGNICVPELSMCTGSELR